METIKQKILVVAAHFFPQNSPRSFRATELVKELSRQGHEVTLYTTKNDQFHTAFEKDYNITIKQLGHIRLASFNIKSKSKLISLIYRAFNRLLLLLFEYPDIQYSFLVRKALKNEKGYNRLISIAVPFPIHWGVAGARTKKNPIADVWIADCGDPYMGSTLDTFNKLFYFKYVEKWFCKKADFITVPTEESYKGYYKEFHSKIRVIPQGFNFDEIKLANYQKNAVPTFIYAGNFIPGLRDPRQFLEYLCYKNQDFKFIIFTQAQWMAMLDPYKSILGDRLILKTYIPREELLSFLCTCDFLVNFDNNSSLQTPSKLIDYALSARPILNIERNINATVIDEFLAGDYKNQMALGSIERYDIKNVANQFLEIS